jgi:hypothetical protein
VKNMIVELKKKDFPTCKNLIYENQDEISKLKRLLRGTIL